MRRLSPLSFLALSLILISVYYNDVSSQQALFADKTSKPYFEHRIKKILRFLSSLVDEMRADDLPETEKQKIEPQMIELYSELKILIHQYEVTFNETYPAVTMNGEIVNEPAPDESPNYCERFQCFNYSLDMNEDVYLDREFYSLIPTKRVKRAGDETDYNFDQDKFDDNWIAMIRDENHPNYKFLDKCWFEDPKSPTRDWFRLVINPQDPNDIKYNCRYCKHYSSPTNLKKPAVSRDYFQNAKWKNKNVIVDHHTTSSHLEAIKNYKRSRNEDAKQRKYDEMGTSNAMTFMLTLVYTEVHKNIGAMHHPDMVMMMKATGSNLGHCLNTARSFTKMLEFLSEQMHTALIRKLKEEKQPLAILLDGSNDRRDRHLIAVSLVTLSENIPTPFFYRIINISPAQDANAMLSGLMNAFFDDGLTDHIKSYLYAYGSDGAKVMISGPNSLDNLLRDEIGKPGLYSVWCQAHRLQLITTHGLRENEIIGPMIQSIERTINDIYSFYHGSPKRKSHLQSTAQRMMRSIPSIRYIHMIRWVDSEVQAFEGILESLDVIIKDLETIRPEVQPTARVKVDALITALHERDLILKMHILYDILKEFSIQSKKLQEFEQSIIDVLPMKEILNQFFNDATELPIPTLKKTTDFIRLCKCNQVQCQGFADYSQSASVSWKGIDLIANQAPPFLTITAFLDSAISSLMDRTEFYFPDGDLSDFGIFNPMKLPNDPTSARNYGCKSISNLAVTFRMPNIDTLCRQWEHLVIELINNPLACGHRSDMPHLFWASVLGNMNDGRFNEIFKLIRVILIIPSGTSTVERYFSSLNHVESPSRTSLSLEHLEDRMRLTLNGPSDFRLMPFNKLAAKWTQSHGTCDQQWFMDEEVPKADHRTLYHYIE